MNTEQKAKAYDEAIERAKQLPRTSAAFDKFTIERIFPELRKSEDERIRKGIIKYLSWIKDRDGSYMPNNIPFDDMLAWLEKQGEQKPSTEVKPKFHEGDWVVFIATESVYQVEKMENYVYTLRHIFGGSFCLSFSIEELIREWTIQDAKDGDVLASELCDSIILFRGIKDNNVDFYCDYDFSKIDIPGNRFTVNHCQHYGSVEDSKDFHPATKEQRDTLFAKMKEAGYTWNGEKKELKKIEQKPMLSDFFNAEYERGKADAQKPAIDIEIPFGAKDSELQEATYYIPKGFHAEIDDDKVVIKKGEKSAEWSEEDENILEYTKEAVINTWGGDTQDLILDWLESLKQRIGG